MTVLLNAVEFADVMCDDARFCLAMNFDKMQCL